MKLGTYWSIAYLIFSYNHYLLVAVLKHGLKLKVLFYGGTSPIKTSTIQAPPLPRQPKLVSSLLTIMKFGLDKNTRREPKGCLFGGLFILLIITSTCLLGENKFLHGPQMYLNFAVLFDSNNSITCIFKSVTYD